MAFSGMRCSRMFCLTHCLGDLVSHGAVNRDIPVIEQGMQHLDIVCLGPHDGLDTRHVDGFPGTLLS